jgi:hypothetical protein
LLRVQGGVQQLAGVIFHLQVPLLALPVLHTELAHGKLLSKNRLFTW